MSPRKLKQAADPPELPTIKDYFGMMAEEQAQDIRRLKHAAIGKKSGDAKRPLADKPVPDAWLMHPVRHAKKAAKSGTKNTERSILKKASKKAQKKTAKRASKKTRH